MAEKEEKLEDALLKVALGYQIAEVTEEYAEVDGTLKLTRKKKTKKDIPPDLKAVQMLLSVDGGEYSSLSDEELEKEKKRLLGELKKGEETSKEGGRCEMNAKKPTKVKKKTTKKSVRKTVKK